MTNFGSMCLYDIYPILHGAMDLFFMHYFNTAAKNDKNSKGKIRKNTRRTTIILTGKKLK